MQPLTVLNSSGKPVILNAYEKQQAEYWTREIKNRYPNIVKNSLGYEINITSLTTIMKEIVEQKFFEIAPADYFPVKVGEGAWSAQLTTYRSYHIAGEFEDGIVNVGANNSRLAVADAGVDALNINVFNWAKTIGWSIIDLQLASRSGNWDLISEKERSRKKSWDLGIQKIAFLGANPSAGSSNQLCAGLLNQAAAGVNTNTTVIPKPIGTMSTSELKTFQVKIVEAFRTNCNRTAWPDRFIIPESDYNSLASQASPDFPIKSTLQLLEEAFMTICRNPKFKILPLAYADGPYNPISPSTQIYTLLKYDPATLNMNIPVDYTNTIANSLDNFQFQSVGYGEFTGVLVLRPLEMMYFTCPTPSPFV